MRLLIDGEVFLRQKEGGISRLFRNLLRLLPIIAPEINTTLVLREMRGNLPDLGPDTEIRDLSWCKVNIRPWRIGRHISPFITQSCVNHAWRGIQADVFCSTYFTVPPVSFPKICIVYDMIVEKFTAMFDPEWAENEKRSKRRAVLAADVILCISENTKRDLVDILGVPESICRVMPLAGFLSASDVSRASDEKLPSDPFFLYVGDYRAPYKNFRRMVSVLGLAGKEFENYTLVVLSTMEPTIQEKNDFYNLMGRDDNIIFRTNCNDALLRAYYSACSVFICPSLYEGFGIPVLEALGCGAPVACSKTSSLPEVGGAFVEYFDPYDEQDISCAIKRALAAGRSEAMLVRRKYAESFSWKKTTEIFADAVKSLV